LYTDYTSADRPYDYLAAFFGSLFVDNVMRDVVTDRKHYVLDQATNATSHLHSFLSGRSLHREKSKVESRFVRWSAARATPFIQFSQVSVMLASAASYFIRNIGL
jgi:hypothetical protein